MKNSEYNIDQCQVLPYNANKKADSVPERGARLMIDMNTTIAGNILAILKKFLPGEHLTGSRTAENLYILAVCLTIWDIMQKMNCLRIAAKNLTENI